MQSIMKISTLFALSLAACSSTSLGARAPSAPQARPAQLAPAAGSRTAIVIIWVCSGDGDAFASPATCSSHCHASFTGPDAQCYPDSP